METSTLDTLCALIIAGKQEEAIPLLDRCNLNETSALLGYSPLRLAVVKKRREVLAPLICKLIGRDTHIHATIIGAFFADQILGAEPNWMNQSPTGGDFSRMFGHLYFPGVEDYPGANAVLMEWLGSKSADTNIIIVTWNKMGAQSGWPPLAKRIMDLYVSDPEEVSKQCRRSLNTRSFRTS